MLTPWQITAFQRWVRFYYQHYGRHQLPWRQDYQPYRVMVSEMMLQQTQVDRVIPKFTAFMARFPTPFALAAAAPAEVITAWQGLGYNRRGLNLQRAAQQLVARHQGQVPDQLEQLLALPGIGPYTAAAIQAFAFNQPSVVVETNIRTVILFHFFHEAYNVDDAALLAVIRQTLDSSNPRQWYSALMDYGAYLKKVTSNPSRRSRQYQRQSTFQGSHQQLRGAILKLLSNNVSLPTFVLHDQLATSLSPTQLEQLELALTKLAQEGFIQRDASQLAWQLAG